MCRRGRRGARGGPRPRSVRAACAKARCGRRSASSMHWPLDESELDYLAETRGWQKLDCASSEAPMASYRRADMRLNFWLSTGTVGSYLDHPRQGKTQLFRRETTMASAKRLLDNPREHTGVGYHTMQEHPQRDKKRSREVETSGGSAAVPPGRRVCIACKRSYGKDMFSKNQRSKGAAARCKICVGARVAP